MRRLRLTPIPGIECATKSLGPGAPQNFTLQRWHGRGYPIYLSSTAPARHVDCYRGASMTQENTISPLRCALTSEAHRKWALKKPFMLESVE